MKHDNCKATLDIDWMSVNAALKGVRNNPELTKAVGKAFGFTRAALCNVDQDPELNCPYCSTPEQVTIA
jgi:hypothetical protein